MIYLWSCLFICAVSNALEKPSCNDNDIKIVCESRSVHILWKVDQSMTADPTRLFLGSCLPSVFTNDTGDGAYAEFYYPLSECGFRRTATWKYLVYENVLSYRPFSKPSPPSFTYPVRCVNDSPDGWTPAYHSLSTGVIRGFGELDFNMAILNHDFTGPAESTVFPLGSLIPIWAGVNQQAHQPLMLFLEECVASSTADIISGTREYPIITNKGCLVDGKNGLSTFLPRYHSSSIMLLLQAFRFAVGQEIYIHCKLTAWDPADFSERKKACNYNKATETWELLDDPFQSSLCQCCDSSCGGRVRRNPYSAPQGLVLKSVLGPLIIEEAS